MDTGVGWGVGMLCGEARWLSSALSGVKRPLGRVSLGLAVRAVSRSEEARRGILRLWLLSFPCMHGPCFPAQAASSCSPMHDLRPGPLVGSTKRHKPTQGQRVIDPDIPLDSASLLMPRGTEGPESRPGERTSTSISGAKASLKR